MNYLFLALAIVSEVAATSSLKMSEQFTKLWPSIIVVAGYGMAFYFLSLCLKSMSIGIIYAVWSGLGIVLVSVVGWFMFKQRLDFPAIAGITMIVVGVAVIYLFSKSVVQQ